MINHYETVYITRPQLSQADHNVIIERVKGVVGNFDGRMLKYVSWGTRRLAYNILKLSEGTYFHMIYSANPQVVKEIERNFRMMDNVIRYLTVKLDTDVDMDTLDVESETPNLDKPEKMPEHEEKYDNASEGFEYHRKPDSKPEVKPEVKPEEIKTEEAKPEEQVAEAPEKETAADDGADKPAENKSEE